MLPRRVAQRSSQRSSAACCGAAASPTPGACARVPPCDGGRGCEGERLWCLASSWCLQRLSARVRRVWRGSIGMCGCRRARTAPRTQTRPPAASTLQIAPADLVMCAHCSAHALALPWRALTIFPREAGYTRHVYWSWGANAPSRQAAGTLYNPLWEAKCVPANATQSCRPCQPGSTPPNPSPSFFLSTWYHPLCCSVPQRSRVVEMRDERAGRVTARTRVRAGTTMVKNFSRSSAPLRLTPTSSSVGAAQVLSVVPTRETSEPRSFCKGMETWFCTVGQQVRVWDFRTRGGPPPHLGDQMARLN